MSRPPMPRPIDTDTVHDLSRVIDLAIREFMIKRNKKPIGGAEVVLAFDMSLTNLKQVMQAVDMKGMKFEA